MSEETKNTAQEEETTDTPVTEETVENEPEVVENGEAETEEGVHSLAVKNTDYPV